MVRSIHVTQDYLTLAMTLSIALYCVVELNIVCI